MQAQKPHYSVELFQRDINLCDPLTFCNATSIAHSAVPGQFGAVELRAGCGKGMQYASG